MPPPPWLIEYEVARVSLKNQLHTPDHSTPSSTMCSARKGLEKSGRGQRVRESEVCACGRVVWRGVCVCESDLLLRVAVSVRVYELLSWEAFLFAAVGRRWECKCAASYRRACLFLGRKYHWVIGLVGVACSGWITITASRVSGFLPSISVVPALYR